MIDFIVQNNRLICARTGTCARVAAPRARSRFIVQNNRLICARTGTCARVAAPRARSRFIVQNNRLICARTGTCARVAAPRARSRSRDRWLKTFSLPLCRSHLCTCCNSNVDELGVHGLCCSFSKGRHSRHASLNDIIKRALDSAKVPCHLEPAGLYHSDGKRPDGASVVPWRGG